MQETWEADRMRATSSCDWTSPIVLVKKKEWNVSGLPATKFSIQSGGISDA